MDVRITPGILHGTAAAVPSKSDLHRAMICAALCDGPCMLDLPSESVLSEDISATADCLADLGAGVSVCPASERYSSDSVFTGAASSLCVTPASPDLATREAELDCGESGSTLRFLIPVAAALGIRAVFTGRGRLPERPLSPLKEELEKNGCRIVKATDRCDSDTEHTPALPLELRGFPDSAVFGKDLCFSLPGNISSQFISGLLFAAPVLIRRGASSVRIRITTPLESSAYVDMTADTMRRFHAEIQCTEDGFLVPAARSDGEQNRYRCPEGGRYAVDGDWSNAAFWLAADYLSGKEHASGQEYAPGITVTGLRAESVQGDKAIRDILPMFREGPDGGNVDSISRSIDVSGIPDLVPVIAAAAALTPGKTRITGAARLRMKESDRLQSTAAMIRSLGGDAEESEDSLLITGKEKLPGGTVDSFHDHRIAMAAAIASVGCTGDVVILDAGAASKSYPSFWEDFRALGGCFTVAETAKPSSRESDDNR